MTSGTNDSGEITQVSGAETAVLAGGCFWGMQDLIRRRPGVLETRVGYTGGQNEHPTYRDHPGHAEASRSSSTLRGRAIATSWRCSSRSMIPRR